MFTVNKASYKDPKRNGVAVDSFLETFVQNKDQGSNEQESVELVVQRSPTAQMQTTRGTVLEST